jgi:hypothetical protein
MLWISTNIQKVNEFREHFRKTHDTTFLDLSKLPSKDLAIECDSIVSHHKECAVFLGYVEPGWMLELSHQTRIRKLFRKFPVAILSFFLESVPFSWKTETDIIYVKDTNLKNGTANSIDDGSSIHDEPES